MKTNQPTRKHKYIISENLDDREEYKGQELTIKRWHKDNYLTLVDIDGKEFFAGREEVMKINH
jgi:hypothetical protein